jgi:hypothetical protein
MCFMAVYLIFRLELTFIDISFSYVTASLTAISVTKDCVLTSYQNQIGACIFKKFGTSV